MSDTIQTRHRPSTLDDVVGHAAVVKSLRKVLKEGSARAFLFTGPSGVGKTTLSRVVASAVGCAPADLLEIDAATYTGIDDMRSVTAGLLYRPLGEGAVKAVIIDEVHGLSKQAWNSLLKMLEEPPSWVYWFLCTTETGRVGTTLQTRCLRYDLKPIPTKTLNELLERVVEAEGWELARGVPDLLLHEANGSARQLLSNLAVCAAAKSRAEAAELLRSAEEASEAVDLARALVRGARWKDVQTILETLKETNAESVRHVVRAYTTKVVLGAAKEADAGRGLEILDAFSEPFNQSDGISPLVIACGRVVL